MVACAAICLQFQTNSLYIATVSYKKIKKSENFRSLKASPACSDKPQVFIVLLLFDIYGAVQMIMSHNKKCLPTLAMFPGTRRNIHAVDKNEILVTEMTHFN